MEPTRATQEPTQPTDTLNAAQAARVAGVSAHTIRQWISEGRLRAYPARGGRRVERAALLRVMAEKHLTPPTQAPAAPTQPTPDAEEPPDPYRAIALYMQPLVVTLERERIKREQAERERDALILQAGILMGLLMERTTQATQDAEEPTAEAEEGAQPPPASLWARVGRWWRGG
jgi:excisionase family DNA binding protein